MVRAPYRTTCRFFRDSEHEDVIHWYVVPWSNGTLGIPSPFMSIRWRPYWVNPGPVGEVTFAEQHYDGWGRIVPPIPGDHLCGEETDFRHGGRYLPSLPPIQRAADGISECCRPELGGMEMGGEALSPDPEPVSEGGVNLAAQWLVEDIFPANSPGSAPLVLPDVWYSFQNFAFFPRWIRFASVVGDVWGIDFVYSTPPAPIFQGVYVGHGGAPGTDTEPWDSYSTTYGEVTHTTFVPGTQNLWLGWILANGPLIGFRVRKLN